MDDIVKLAMAKWPKVPHCYGWLALDARGQWRMRDDRAQSLNLPGDPIRNLGLQQFINRNYECDAEGRWYFQNGPQKVYVDLECTPYIAQLLPEQEWRLHTGQILKSTQQVYMLDDGNLVLRHEHILAQVDDRDLAQALEFLMVDGRACNEEDLAQLLEVMSDASTEMSQLNADQTSHPFLRAHQVYLNWQGEKLMLQRCSREALMAKFSYQKQARATQDEAL